jgi:predicted transcriptional regulator
MWWLLTQEVEKRPVAVKAALRELVTQGFVLERKGREGRVYYYLNQRKKDEIHARLAERLGQGE